MKRKVPVRRVRRNWSYDVRKDLTQGQLAGIGTMALAWNDAEAMYDVLFCVVLGLHSNLWRDVATRINGIEGKHEIIRRAIAARFGIPSGFIADMIGDTIGAVGELRGYRDTIIHSRIIDVALSIGEAASGRGRKVEEVLLTETALSGVCDRMIIMRQELQALISWFEEMETLGTFDRSGAVVEHLAIRHMHSRLASMSEGKTGILVPEFQEYNTAEIGLKVQRALSQYQHHQERRKALQPLPAFPKGG
jgi:hypothetical protein